MFAYFLFKLFQYCIHELLDTDILWLFDNVTHEGMELLAENCVTHFFEHKELTPENRPPWLQFLRQELLKENYDAQIGPSGFSSCLICVIKYQAEIISAAMTGDVDPWCSAVSDGLLGLMQAMVAELYVPDPDLLTAARFLRKKLDYYYLMNAHMASLTLSPRTSLVTNLILPLDLTGFAERSEELVSAARNSTDMRRKKRRHRKQLMRLVDFFQGSDVSSKIFNQRSFVINPAAVEAYRAVRFLFALTVETSVAQVTVRSGYFQHTDGEQLFHSFKMSKAVDSAMSLVTEHFRFALGQILPQCHVINVKRYESKTIWQLNTVVSISARVEQLMSEWNVSDASSLEGKVPYQVPEDTETGITGYEARETDDDDLDGEECDLGFLTGKELVHMPHISSGRLRTGDALGRKHRLPTGDVSYLEAAAADPYQVDCPVPPIFSTRLLRAAGVENDVCIRSYDLSIFTHSLCGVIVPCLLSLGNTFMVQGVIGLDDMLARKLIILESIFDMLVGELQSSNVVSLQNILVESKFDFDSTQLGAVSKVLKSVLELRRACLLLYLSSENLGYRFHTNHSFRADSIVSCLSVCLGPLFNLTRNPSTCQELALWLSNLHMPPGDLCPYAENMKNNPLVNERVVSARGRLSPRLTFVPENISSNEKSKLALALLSHSTHIGGAESGLSCMSSLRDRQFQSLMSHDCSCVTGANIPLDELIKLDDQKFCADQSFCFSCVPVRCRFYFHGTPFGHEMEKLRSIPVSVGLLNAHVTDFFDNPSLMFSAFPNSLGTSMELQVYPAEILVRNVSTQSRKRAWRDIWRETLVSQKKPSESVHGSILNLLALLCAPLIAGSAETGTPEWLRATLSHTLRAVCLNALVYDLAETKGLNFDDLCQRADLSQLTDVDVIRNSALSGVAGMHGLQRIFSSHHPFVQFMRKLGYVFPDYCLGRMAIGSFFSKFFFFFFGDKLICPLVKAVAVSPAQSSQFSTTGLTSTTFM